MQNINGPGGRSSSEADEEPAAKRARTLAEADLGGPTCIDDEDTARAKLGENGFGENLTETQDVRHPNPYFYDHEWSVSPMIHFCAAGDLKMVRYLVSRGVSPTQRINNDEDFPMCAAAREGQVGVCKWLRDHGAREDVAATASDGDTPFQSAMDPSQGGLCSETAKWLIQNGALRDGLSPSTELYLVQKFHQNNARTGSFTDLLQWIEDTVSVNFKMRLFLLGTVHPPKFSEMALRDHLSRKLGSQDGAEYIFARLSASERENLWDHLLVTKHSSPLRVFSGKEGILSLIAKFSGFIGGQSTVYKSLCWIQNSLLKGPHSMLVAADTDSSSDGSDGSDGGEDAST